MGTSSRFVAAAVTALVAAATSARADAIDGDWCHPDGRRFTIHGPQIVTPGGAQLEGDYSRHYFSYVVPGVERPAGQTVFMTLLNENTVHLRAGAADAAPEEWRRCSPSIS